MTGEGEAHRVTADSPNQEVVLRAFSASNRGDVAGFLDCLGGDVEWRSGGIFIHPVRRWQGRDALGAAWSQCVKERGAPTKVVVRELDEIEERLLVVGDVLLPAAQRPVKVTGAWIFEMRAGRVAKVSGFAAVERARAEWRHLRRPR
jgi:ketosteroid isomerase-like protein